MKRSLLALSCAILAPAAFAQKVGSSDLITPERLAAHLYFIADDLLEGRNTPSRGLDIACKYVEAQLKLWGVKPMGDNGTYFQKLPMQAIGFDPAGCSMKIGDRALRYAYDFRGDAGTGVATGQVVVVGGGGLVSAAQGIDPYKGLDVKGKLVLICGAGPENISNPERPEAAAARLGAAGILVTPRRFQADSWKPDDYLRSAVRYTLADPNNKPAPVLPRVVMSKSGLAALLGGEDKAESLIQLGYEGEVGKSYALNGPAVSLNLGSAGPGMTASNVVGFIEGSDPVLKKEIVAIGAHIDHVGMGGNGPDKIFNGADDDGSGTVSILEIAHAFSQGIKPKRSLLFVWHCGEEKGLWGSRYFVENPTVDLKNVVAQLNIDMIGRTKFPGDNNPRNANLSGPNEVFLIGSRRMSSELSNHAKKANASLYNMAYNEFYDRPNDPESLFSRSDHYNYAVKGIPILFWFDGIHEDYHQLGDEPQKIDYKKMSRVAQSVYATAIAVGNAPKRPAIDLPMELK